MRASAVADGKWQGDPHVPSSRAALVCFFSAKDLCIAVTNYGLCITVVEVEKNGRRHR